MSQRRKSCSSYRLCLALFTPIPHPHHAFHFQCKMPSLMQSSSSCIEWHCRKHLSFPVLGSNTRWLSYQVAVLLLRLFILEHRLTSSNSQLSSGCSFLIAGITIKPPCLAKIYINRMSNLTSVWTPTPKPVLSDRCPIRL